MCIRDRNIAGYTYFINDYLLFDVEIIFLSPHLLKFRLLILSLLLLLHGGGLETFYQSWDLSRYHGCRRCAVYNILLFLVSLSVQKFSWFAFLSLSTLIIIRIITYFKCKIIFPVLNTVPKTNFHSYKENTSDSGFRSVL